MVETSRGPLMEHTIVGNPDYGELLVTLAADEVLIAESGAMSRMSPHMRVKTVSIGSFGKALWRRLTAKESVFAGKFSDPEGGEVAVSPNLPGTVFHREMQGGDDKVYLTGGSFLACTPGIKLRSRFGGFRSFFSGEGVFILEATGEGSIWYSGYGACFERHVEGALTVDTGHVVAWDPSLDYTIKEMGSLKTTLFSGEGLVMNFTGSGTIVLQTRTAPGIADWISPLLPV